MIAYYEASLPKFLQSSRDEILGELASRHQHDLEHLQRGAWIAQINLLQAQLAELGGGQIFFEFHIPRMGKRADVVLVTNSTVFVIEFKVGASSFDRAAIEQVHDYSLDLKNFHLGSHDLPIIPILVATQATGNFSRAHWFADKVAKPICIGADQIRSTIQSCMEQTPFSDAIDIDGWRNSGYKPTPTIIEAAEALYRDHDVEEISRSDAGAKNLHATADRIANIIENAIANNQKAICFVTGVPGAGKTLAGLNIAARRANQFKDENAVFLSGNGPLVIVLREALARDQHEREKIKKGDAHRAVSQFIQNIHHFRDHYVGSAEVPFEKVVIFDEAQRAWTKDQASKFMQQKRGHADFDMSEPEFLIGVMDRHEDWCCVVCLIGGGQEINTGEAGIGEWLTALRDKFQTWEVHASDILHDRHYTIDETAREMLAETRVGKHDDLHLAVSMRSFRAERLSSFVSAVLDNNPLEASSIFVELQPAFPLALTRDLEVARNWLRGRARGSERFGLVASSGAYRLRADGLHVRASIDPSSWFLNDRDDVRSSYFLEEAATEFDIQGLELDWVGVCWDADLRYANGQWHHHAFRGSKWINVNAETKRNFLVNAYRVLMTRARQGMVVFVPRGSNEDHTRPNEYYDATADYLKRCGIPEIA